MNVKFLEIRRAANIMKQSVWYYVLYRGVELHEQQGPMVGLPRTENISTFSESSDIFQTDEVAAKNMQIRS